MSAHPKLQRPREERGMDCIGVAWWPDGKVRYAQYVRKEKAPRPERGVAPEPQGTKVARGALAAEQGQLL